MASSVSPKVVLQGGLAIPSVGLGLWKSKKGEVGAAVRAALECGVRLLDGAQAYENEAEVGEALEQALKEGVARREDVFVVGKLPNTMHVWEADRQRPLEALRRSLRDLRLQQLDLFLMHWPIAFEQKELGPIGGLRLKDGTPNPRIIMKVEFLETWAEMVKLRELGLTRAIGVCNFTQHQLEELLAHFPTAPPAVNQCEIHPYLAQAELKAFCDQHGITMMAYSPLGSGDSYSGTSFPARGTGPFESPLGGSTLLSNDLVKAIAAKVGKSPAQVLLRWSIQRGFVVIPKSIKPERIKENSELFSWSLPEEEMARLAELDCGFRYGIGYVPGHYDCPNAPWKFPGVNL